MDYSYWFSVILDGAISGCIYGILGLCIVVIFRSNRLFNFSLTQLATFILLYLVLLLSKQYNFYFVILLGLVVSFAVGGLLHFTVMRYISEKKQSQHSSEVLLTIGIFSVLDGLSHYFFIDEPSDFPSLFPRDQFLQIGELQVSYQSLGIVGVSASILLLIYLFFKYSKMGLKMEAVAENTMAARLRGIRASNVLAFAWAMTTMLSVTAGIMIAPIIFVSPTMFSYIFSFALIAVVLGGLESPTGAILGGILIGITENVGSQFDFIGSDLKFVTVFILMLILLTVKPRGLWGRFEGRRV